MAFQQHNRRDFIKIAFYALGAVALTSFSFPQIKEIRNTSLFNPEINKNDTSMNNIILVTYASHTGFTRGIAESIKQILEKSGESVELCPMQNVKDISSYKAVIAGSAIQDKKWLPEAMQFMQKHQMMLSKKPFAAFLVCMTLAMPNGEKYQQEVMKWLNPVRELVRPVKEGFFAGGLDISKIPSFSDRLKFRASVALGIWSEGDHRDWNAIQAWVHELKPLVQS